MIDILFKIWKTKTVTKKDVLHSPAAENYRGKIEILDADSPQLLAAAEICPSGALFVDAGGKVSLFHGACVFCGACAKICGSDVLRQSNEFRLAAADKQELYEKSGLDARGRR